MELGNQFQFRFLKGFDSSSKKSNLILILFPLTGTEIDGSNPPNSVLTNIGANP
jgi:hypothetical protein